MDIKALNAEYQRDLSSRREVITVSKLDLEATIQAIEIWVEKSLSWLDEILPEKSRIFLSAVQKQDLIQRVVLAKLAEQAAATGVEEVRDGKR